MKFSNHKGYLIPKGATPLMVISLPDKKVIPEPGFQKIAKETSEKIGGYVDECGDLPPCIKPWRDIAKAIVAWKAGEQ